MNKKMKIALYIVGGLSILGIGAGFGLYLYNRANPKEEKAKEAEKDKDGEPSLDLTPVTVVPFSTDAPQGSEDIKSFQTWVNTNKKPTPLLKVDGIWGSKSQAKWDEFGKPYSTRNRTVGGVGSGMTYGQSLWSKSEMTNVYSYPLAETKYLLGYAKRSAKYFARYEADSNTAGWIKVKAIYTKLSGGNPVVQVVYVQLKDVTTVAP